MRAEHGFSINPSADATFLVSNVGGGKRTFFLPIEEQARASGYQVQVLEPTDGNLVTKNTWRGMRWLYEQAGRPGWLQDKVGADRAMAKPSLKDEVILHLANSEAKSALAGAKNLVTFHGMFGQGLARNLVDADIVPEPRGVDSQTTILVPTEETRDRIHAIGNAKDIEVVGFVVPEKLRDPKRPGRIVEQFEKGLPTADDPMRLAFLMTGQVAHKDDLLTNVLYDPTIRMLLRDGRIKLDTYFWNNQREAEQLQSVIKGLKLPSRVTTQYDPESADAIQIYWNKDPNQAVSDSFAMIANASVMITPPAERTPFAATTYPVFLDPVRGNAKMEGNDRWLNENGVSGPDHGVTNFGDTFLGLFDDDGAAVKKHFLRAADVFEEGALLQGAQKSVEVIFAS